MTVLQCSHDFRILLVNRVRSDLEFSFNQCFELFLAEHCNFIAKSGCCHDVLSLCQSSSATLVYCDKTAATIITLFSRKSN